MKNHRGKRRKKGKTSQRHAKETSTGAEEINPLAEEAKEIKPDRFQFNLVCADHYSLYERTSVKQEARKEGESSESIENEAGMQAKCLTKGQHKSALPPLRDLARSQKRKRLTFVEKTHDACGQSKLDTKLEDDGSHTKENVASTSSENPKKLASLSFVGIYDLDDMGKSETNNNDGTLKSGKQEDEGERNYVDKVSEHVERTRSYVIQTLTLEGESSLRRKPLFQDKFILPGIKENRIHFLNDEYKTSKRREALCREGERNNRLPRLIQNENRTPRKIESSSKRAGNRRGKIRTHHNSFEQVYLEREIPRLPLVVNGRITQF